MTHYRIAAALSLMFAVPAVAQDVGGAVDLGALSRTQVQALMMQGHAERDGAQRTTKGRNGVALSAKSRAYCDAFPSYRSRYGVDDPRVVRLAAACRQAGYGY